MVEMAAGQAGALAQPVLGQQFARVGACFGEIERVSRAKAAR